jgi:hypothetical protein
VTMKCRTCRSEMREDIDIALVSGKEPLRNIAERADISLASVFRHKESHLPALMANAKQAQELTRSDVLVTTAAGLLDRALGLLDRAEAAQDLRAATGALRECRSVVELLAKLRPSEDLDPDDDFALQPVQWREWIAVAVPEFRPFPNVADEFMHELALSYFKLLNEYAPKLRPGAANRLRDEYRRLSRERGL